MSQVTHALDILQALSIDNGTSLVRMTQDYGSTKAGQVGIELDPVEYQASDVARVAIVTIVYQPRHILEELQCLR